MKNETKKYNVYVVNQFGSVITTRLNKNTKNLRACVVFMLDFLFDKTLVLFHEIENQRNPSFVLLNDYVNNMQKLIHKRS